FLQHSKIKKQEEILIPSCLAFFYLCTFWGAVQNFAILLYYLKIPMGRAHNRGRFFLLSRRRLLKQTDI
ncbi:MAG: hypothetical protein PUI31_05110, partial [Clostridia bacterium]|nr:hypothetical protein [Clostridia bacterium]